MSKAIIHFLDSARGQYIPRDFAQIIKRSFVSGVSDDLLDSLAKDNSNEGEFYWEDWQTVLNNAKINFEGVQYTLRHDGDLWLVNYEALAEQERINFGFEDY